MDDPEGGRADDDHGEDAMSSKALDPWTVDTVEAMESARCAAMIAGDGSQLREMLSDDATWVHSSGQVDDRDGFVGKIENGASRYLTIERSETTVRLAGDAAIASGVATMEALANGQSRSLRNRYVNVWMLRNGQPILVSAQSTKLP